MTVADELVERIYEAGAMPELWPSVLDELARGANALGWILFTAGPHGTGWTASDAARPLFARFVADGWGERNLRVARAAALNHAGFVRDQDLVIPSAEVIQGLLDLTPAEARVARGIARGLTVDNIASHSCVSVGTVRVQLRSVFDKTGVVRQAELVSLLAGCVLPKSQ